MKLFEVTYYIGKWERTCLCAAENRADAHAKIAATEPDDVTIHIVRTEQMDLSVVWQLNERLAPTPMSE